MNQFECTVYDQHGIRQVVTINGSSNEDDAKLKLLQAGYSVAKIAEIKETSAAVLCLLAVNYRWKIWNFLVRKCRCC